MAFKPLISNNSTWACHSVCDAFQSIVNNFKKENLGWNSEASDEVSGHCHAAGQEPMHEHTQRYERLAVGCVTVSQGLRWNLSVAVKPFSICLIMFVYSSLMFLVICLVFGVKNGTLNIKEHNVFENSVYSLNFQGDELRIRKRSITLPHTTSWKILKEWETLSVSEINTWGLWAEQLPTLEMPKLGKSPGNIGSLTVKVKVSTTQNQPWRKWSSKQ